MKFIKQPVSSATLHRGINLFTVPDQYGMDVNQSFLASASAFMLGLAQKNLAEGASPLQPMMLVRSGPELVLYDASPAFAQHEDQDLRNEVRNFLLMQAADAYIVYCEAELAVHRVITDHQPTQEEVDAVSEDLKKQLEDATPEEIGLHPKDVVRMEAEIKDVVHFLGFINIVDEDEARGITIKGSVPPMVTRTTDNPHCVLSSSGTVH